MDEDDKGEPRMKRLFAEAFPMVANLCAKENGVVDLELAKQLTMKLSKEFDPSLKNIVHQATDFVGGSRLRRHQRPGWAPNLPLRVRTSCRASCPAVYVLRLGVKKTGWSWMPSRSSPCRRKAAEAPRACPGRIQGRLDQRTRQGTAGRQEGAARSRATFR
jgi:hypothetical protein